jgi:hypothetical protein
MLLLVLLLGAGATMAAALSTWQMGKGVDGGQALTMSGLAVVGAVAGFRCGRRVVHGRLFARRSCDSCGARRTGTGAFCESCGRRD